MTVPRRDYRSFFQVIPVQAMCARCDAKSPVVFARKPPDKHQYLMRDREVRASVGERLRDEGWDLSEKMDKSFCPVCRRMGL
jgi:hypothetical protein